MRLYVQNKRNPRLKIYLKVEASTRFELRNLLRGDYFTLNGIRYHVNDVKAESGSNSTATGAVLGGVIGLVGGPWGVAAGVTAGGLLGKQEDNRDNERVSRFNQSSVNGWKTQVRY
jgi:hypothetical protein